MGAAGCSTDAVGQTGREECTNSASRTPSVDGSGRGEEKCISVGGGGYRGGGEDCAVK